MNSFKRDILNLLKSALTKEVITISADFDWEKAYRLGKAHGILPMLHYGAFNSGLDLPDEIAEKLKKMVFKGVFIDQNQLHETEEIRRCFIDNKIDFLPLKGMLIKHMYPCTDMRIMGDADILIRVEQYDAIKPIMEKLGYTELKESDHELIWEKKGALHVELHKRLIPSYNKDYYNYFEDGWKLACKTDTTEHKMKNEDNFIYLFTHYAKHYRDAGIGIRHLVDIYVFLKSVPSLDWDYIDGELKKLQLLDFCRNSIDTVHVWFGDFRDTEITDFITEWIFTSGSYGTREKLLKSEGLKASKKVDKNDVKKSKLKELVFPSAKKLSSKYTVLKKYPFSLPFVWVYRWITAMIFRRSNIKKHQESIEMMTADKISEFQRGLNFVGLDFNFEE